MGEPGYVLFTIVYLQYDVIVTLVVFAVVTIIFYMYLFDLHLYLLVCLRI